MYYARLTVRKAQADMGRESGPGTAMRESEQIDAGRSSLERGDGARQMADQQLLRPRAGALQESARLDGITCSAMQRALNASSTAR